MIQKMRLLFKSKLIVFILYLTVNITFGQNYTEKKNIIKTFPVSNLTTVDITNKYGKIDIITWNNDSVAFNIELSVSSEDEKKLFSLMNNVDFQFQNTSYFLQAKTIFKSDKSFLVDFMKITESLTSPQTQVRVDYVVLIPKNVDLKINNKYGDVYIENIESDLNIDISNGNLKAGKLTGKLKFQFDFCNKINISELKTADITANYSEINIKSAERINFITKSTKVYLEEIQILNINSKRDKFSVNNLDHLYGDTYFSDILTNQINKEITLDMKYGELFTEIINKTVSTINLTSKYTDIELNFRKPVVCKLDISYKKTVLDIPENIGTFQKKDLPDQSKWFYGNIGSGESSSTLKIKSESGNIRIRTK